MDFREKPIFIPFIDKHVSRQPTRQILGAQINNNLLQGKKIIWKAPAFQDYFFALFRVIKI